jgi:uridine monophosphate synthetase
MSSLNHSEKIKSELLESNFIKEGTFVLKSGLISNFYVDIKSIFSKPQLMHNLCNMLYIKIIEYINKNKIKLENIAICGLPYAGIPFASFISLSYNIPLILLRKERKGYGTNNMIEGDLSNTTHLILIDDILTTGTSILNSLENFVSKNLKISAFIILDREQDSEVIGIENKDILYNNLDHISVLFKLSDFV